MIERMDTHFRRPLWQFVAREAIVIVMSVAAFWVAPTLTLYALGVPPETAGRIALAPSGCLGAIIALSALSLVMQVERLIEHSGVAACGADYADMSKTEAVDKVTCPHCRAARFSDAEIARLNAAVASPPVHWMHTPGVAACGADATNTHTTEVRNSVTCRWCHDWFHRIPVAP